MHCALDLKWGGAETMAMKKTWHGCVKQPTSITLEGTVPKMVHDKVDARRGDKHSHMMGLNDSLKKTTIFIHGKETYSRYSLGGRVDFSPSPISVIEEDLTRVILSLTLSN